MPLTTDSIREAVFSLYPDNLRNEISAKDMRDGMRLVADVIDAQPADSFWSVITEAQFVEIQDARADVAADAAQVEADRLATETARDEVLAASQVLRAHFVTVGGQTFYPAGVGGVPAAIIEDGHILFGASPFGPLTYGVDYSVDGGIQFTFDPGEGSLFHLVTMPRFTNSEAQVILQDLADAVEAAGLVYPSRAAAIAALSSLPLSVQKVSWNSGVGVIDVARKVGATDIPDMVGWVPDGDVYPQHFGSLCNGTGNDAIGIGAAIVWLNAIGGGVLNYSGAIRLQTCVEMLSNVSHDFGSATLVSPGSLGRSPAGSVVVEGETVTYGAAHDLFYARGRSNIHIKGGALLDTSGQTGWLSASRLFDFIGCDNYSVTGVRAKVPGAFIASRFCRDYLIAGNTIDVASTDNLDHHDGVIDQWWGSHDFTVSLNTVNGNGVARWPILVTGVSSDSSVGKKCYGFSITNNRASGSKEPGIFVMGRSGLCEAFSLSGNFVVDCAKEGIIIADAFGGVVTGNITRRTGGIGIILRSESAPTYGDNGARCVHLGGNIVEDANLSGSTSAFGGSAIAIISDSVHLEVVGNIVRGTSHTYALYVNGAEDGESHIHIWGGSYPSGTQGDVAWTSSPDKSTAIYNDNTGLLRIRSTVGVRIDGSVTRLASPENRFITGATAIFENSSGADVGRIRGLPLGLQIEGLAGPYNDDANAASAGVIVGGLYRKTGGVLAWRQS